MVTREEEYRTEPANMPSDRSDREGNIEMPIKDSSNAASPLTRDSGRGATNSEGQGFSAYRGDDQCVLADSIRF